MAPYISMTMTPMVLTARLMKRRDPNCRVAFIGPCAAKKLEASRRSVRSEVDFVLTFEELRGMFEAKNIDFSQIPDAPSHFEASAPGVGFAASGGVAKAVEDVIHRERPNMEVKTVYAEGLRECRQMLRVARTGKYDGYLLEGMACPGGCIAGAGTARRRSPRRGWKSTRPPRPSATPWRRRISRISPCCTRTARNGSGSATIKSRKETPMASLFLRKTRKTAAVLS